VNARQPLFWADQWKRMSLFSITYVSTRVGDFIAKRIVDLAERASAYNSVSEVTGFLCHVDALFLQTIEGEYAEVNRIYHTRIVPARTHRNLRLIQLETHAERRFANWTMGFADITPADRGTADALLPEWDRRDRSALRPRRGGIPAVLKRVDRDLHAALTAGPFVPGIIMSRFGEFEWRRPHTLQAAMRFGPL
jgi:hypothetical protein